MTHSDESAVLDTVRRILPHMHEVRDGATDEIRTLVDARVSPREAGRDTHARKQPFANAHADAERLRRALAASTCVMVAWSLFEVPWELDITSSVEQTAAVVASKTILMLIAALSLRGRRWARYLLLFVCLTSVFAIAPELPAEFDRAPWLAFLSSVECGAKLLVLLLLAMYFKATRERPVLG